jgi:hypothetical protein
MIRLAIINEAGKAITRSRALLLRVPAVPDIAAEDGPVKTVAQGPDRLHLWRADASRAAARPPDAQQEILQLKLGKRRGKIGGRLARRRGQNLCPITAFSASD